MQHRFTFLAALVCAFVLGTGTLSAQQQKTATKKKQFAFVLKLIPRLLDDNAWTKDDEEAVGKHFRRLQRLHKQGIVLFAGRTLTNDNDQFGLVIVQAASKEEAEILMNEDDAVKAGIMTTKLFPFAVALK